MENLYEATRNELLNKSKSAKKVKSYDSTRYDRRNQQKPLSSEEIFNRIDFNALFKSDLLPFSVPVQGETKTYNVEVFFKHVCQEVKKQVKSNNNLLEYKCLYRAIINAINISDILINCECDDFKYRQSYYATKQHYNSGQPELRPSDITNPDDSAGGGCKHVLSVLGNLDWAVKLASSIYNYTVYMEENKNDLFVKFIFPQLYDISYEEYLKLKNPEDESEEPIEEPEEPEEPEDIEEPTEEVPEEIPEEGEEE